MFIYIHIRSYYMLFLYFNLFLRVMLDSLSCLFTSISVLITCCSFALTYFLEWCWIVSHVYFIHIRSYYMLFLFFNLFLIVMLDSLSCLFTSISVLITCCSFTLTCFLEWCWIVSHVYLHPYPFLLHAVPLL